MLKTSAALRIACLFALMPCSANGQGGTAAAPQPTPQQAIDFVKSKVEQFGTFSCSQRSIPEDRQTLIEFNGPSVIMQTKFTAAVNSATTVSEAQTNTVSLDGVDSITVKPSLDRKCGVTLYTISFLCKAKCVLYRNSRTVSGGVGRDSSETASYSFASFDVSDEEMAGRIAKALDFYRQTVASAPSPF